MWKFHDNQKLLVVIKSKNISSHNYLTRKVKNCKSENICGHVFEAIHECCIIKNIFTLYKSLILILNFVLSRVIDVKIKQVLISLKYYCKIKNYINFLIS